MTAESGGRYEEYLEIHHAALGQALLETADMTAPDALSERKDAIITKRTTDWSEDDWQQVHSGLEQENESRRKASEDQLPLSQLEISPERARDIYAFMCKILRSNTQLGRGLSFGDMGKLMTTMRTAYPEHLDYKFDVDAHLDSIRHKAQ